MANTKQARKRVRHNVRAAAVNKQRLSRIRNAVRKVESALAAGDKKAAEAALKLAKPEISRGIRKGAIHRNAAARKVSRLQVRLNSLAK
jgi:small subunit ribosomal protein S20